MSGEDYEESSSNFDRKAVAAILDHGLRTKHYRETVLMVLQCFCGVRSHESGKMTWRDIDIKKRHVGVSSDNAKNSNHRICYISDNAYRYLVICMENLQIRAKDLDKRILPNFENRMRLFRHTFNKFKIPTNVLRHSFGSYHYAKGEDINQTRNLMGHREGEYTFLSHYRDVVTKKTG